MLRILSQILIDRRATIDIPKALYRSVIVLILLVIIVQSTGSGRLAKLSESAEHSTSKSGSAESLPSGMVRSDWDGILTAHREWKHEVKPNGSGWKAHNPATGLTASFDRRGVEVRPEGAAWTWGLDLVSYGVGKAQVLVGKRTPAIQTAAREVTYGWDDNLEEWYRNHDRGFEHGFTIKRRPEAAGADGSLELNLKVEGDLQVTGVEDRRSVVFGKKAGEALLRYSDLKVVDAQGKDLKARFDRDGNDILRIVVEDRMGTYPITIDPTIKQLVYLKASNTDAGDHFGISVAIHGQTVVIGASGEDSSANGINSNQIDNSAQDSGAAYVFVRSGLTWYQEAYLKASNTDANDKFGESVAISGDTIVVGSPGEDSNAVGANGEQNTNAASEAGAVYIFARIGSTWSQQSYIKSSNTDSGDNFGISVSISGDTLVAGAFNEDGYAKGVNGIQTTNTSQNSGAAYVFIRNGVAWSQQAYLKASNTDAEDRFGATVGISAETIVIGAPNEDSSSMFVNGYQNSNTAVQSGAAYIFIRNSGIWSQQAYLKASNAETLDYFGAAAAVSGDTVIIGAIGEDSDASGVNGNQLSNSASDSGAAYIFFRSGMTWSQQAYLKGQNIPTSGTQGIICTTCHDVITMSPPIIGIGDRFGSSVAILGDAVIVGAPQEDIYAIGIDDDPSVWGALNSGAAYIFVRLGVNWTKQVYLKANNTEADDNYGYSVAISADRAVIGGLMEASNATGADGNDVDNSVMGAGAVYVYSRLSPAIYAVSSVTRTIGAQASSTLIATVSDNNVAAQTMTVNVLSSNPTQGVSISNIVNINGEITADIAAECTSSEGSVLFTLQVSNGTQSATATLVVDVVQNTAPVLSYALAKVNAGSSSVINSTNGLTDNGTIKSVVVYDLGSYTGTISVDMLGVVALANAAPIGTHTITIRSTDNCGLVTDSVLTITVNAIPVVIPATNLLGIVQNLVEISLRS